MLDPEGVEDIKRLIQETKREHPDLTFISITHDIEEAYMSDRVIILNKGEIYKDGKPDEVFKDEDEIRKIGLDIPFVQDNQSLSKKGVLRGLHFQKQYPQTKLVRVIKGTVYDVVVDLRADSGTFGKWHGEFLSEENRKQLLIPKGFAHGFLVLSDVAEFCYKCDDFYHANDEGGVAWNDPAIGIAWPEVIGTYPGNASVDGYSLSDGTRLTVSEKDQNWRTLRDTSMSSMRRLV